MLVRLSSSRFKVRKTGNNVVIFEFEQDFCDDDSFLENDLIDSTGVLELVAFIEENFNIRVEDEELIPENLDSVNKLINYIQLKMNS